MRSKMSYILVLVLTFVCLSGCSGKGASNKTEEGTWHGLVLDHSMELEYANQFSVDYYEGGYARIRIVDGGEFLLVPKNGSVPEGLPSDVTILQQPFSNIYLVATSAMDLVCAIGGTDAVTLSGLKEEDWYIEGAKEAMAAGDMVYAGKYNMPDYELILSKNCDLAVESTMIAHSPEVQEQLEGLGIPVLVEHSSYESHPLGRLEWIKLYGALLGREEQAQQYFEEQAAKVQGLGEETATGKKVAFFYITSNGAANVRKSGDYVAKMVELAGGAYIFQDLGDGDSAMSTMNMEMETFYAAAKDADVIIYNSAIDAELYTLEELFEKSELLKDFKAVKEGQVWCTGKNMFQETTGVGDMIVDIHKALTEENPADKELTYLHRLK